MRIAAIAGGVLLLSSCGPSQDDAHSSRGATAATTSPAPSAQPAEDAAEHGPPPPTHPCLLQGRDRLAVKPRRAVGTEPFWGAMIEGRCVLYSTPEDQGGTRIWTRYSEAAGVELWSGMLQGRLFELQIRGRPGCSDGMSDKRYPFAVALKVQGEVRQGCAEPAEAPTEASPTSEAPKL